LNALLISSMVLLLWPAVAHAQVRVAVDTTGELKAVLDLQGDAARGKGPGDNVARGKDLYAKDCARCHGGSGEGRADMFYPMIAAQHYSYLLRGLAMIRDGDRGHFNAEIVAVVKAYAQADLQAVADYTAQLPPPKK
jgi:cytochrome c553